jgi:hypothetical protein
MPEKPLWRSIDELKAVVASFSNFDLIIAIKAKQPATENYSWTKPGERPSAKIGKGDEELNILMEELSRRTGGKPWEALER